MDLFEKDNQKKTKTGFNILSTDSTDGHGGYGTGVIDLNNVSPIIVNTENDEAFVDMGALHARSAVEKRIKFTPNREDSPNGKLYWLVWVSVNNKGAKPFYAGVTACEMVIDMETRRGYKSLPEHVNRMDKSLKGHIIVDHMDEKSKKILGDFLKSHNEDMWKHSELKLRQELLGEEQ
ncbi:MAG: YwhD family protein [Bacillaceae bacterium]|uniref:YwhD family protein n=1 Tax=Alkalihalobacterium chitinilyticum TaxID=2980103 RepID=A0ABT5VGT4_9BACI|nr:YwhD family protein [Alkalihalobacterium chitinilyticum]MDE5414651.1 YwhD family protein [Alkalihalobacterium chitinilyticum]MEB1808163.1 YwhD family protein [Bacillaceae bacterium]